MSMEITSQVGAQAPPIKAVVDPVPVVNAKAAVQKPLPAETKPASKPLVDQEELQRNLREAIDRLNEQMKRSGRNLSFSMDKELDRIVISVRNSATGELVRQIPDESLMRAAHSIEQLRGLILNQKV